MMNEFENRLNHLLLNFGAFLCLALVQYEKFGHGFKKSLYFAYLYQKLTVEELHDKFSFKIFDFDIARFLVRPWRPLLVHKVNFILIL